MLTAGTKASQVKRAVVVKFRRRRLHRHSSTIVIAGFCSPRQLCTSTYCKDVHGDKFLGEGGGDEDDKKEERERWRKKEEDGETKKGDGGGGKEGLRLTALITVVRLYYSPSNGTLDADHYEKATLNTEH